MDLISQRRYRGLNNRKELRWLTSKVLAEHLGESNMVTLSVLFPTKVLHSFNKDHAP